MTLQEMMKEVERLSPEEMRQLREHIEQKEREIHQPGLDIDAIERIFSDLRAGFSEADLSELEWAMNVEYKGTFTIN